MSALEENPTLLFVQISGFGSCPASWSADGQHIAYVADSRQLNITSSNFADTLQHELPNRLSDEDNDSDDLHGTFFALSMK